MLENTPNGVSKKDELSLPTPLYFKPNFLKADSLAFALSCDRILDLLFALSSMFALEKQVASGIDNSEKERGKRLRSGGVQ